MSLVDKVEQLKGIELIHSISSEAKQLVIMNQIIKERYEDIEHKMCSLFATVYMLMDDMYSMEDIKATYKNAFWKLNFRIRNAHKKGIITWSHAPNIPYLVTCNVEGHDRDLLSLKELREYLDKHNISDILEND